MYAVHVSASLMHYDVVIFHSSAIHPLAPDPTVLKQICGVDSFSQFNVLHVIIVFALMSPSLVAFAAS